MARGALEQWQFHLILIQEVTGSNPVRATQFKGPIGQWLGRLPFKQEKAGRNRLGSPRGGVTETCRTHNPDDEGSTPSCAINLAWPNGRAADC